MLFTAAEVPVRYVAVPQQREETPETDDALADTVLDVIVRRLEAQARRPTRCGCRRWTARRRR